MSNNLSARKYALDYFTGCGWSPEQASGIVANLECESGLRADAVGDGGLAYGIAQWHPDRQEHFTQILGKPIRGSSLADQLSFVHAELQSTEKRAGDALSACTSARDSGALISRMYERPADREGEAQKRAELAQRIFQDQSQPAAPIEDHSTILPKPEKSMGALALLQLFGPILTSMIPQISTLLKPGSKAETYAGIAQTVLNTITTTAKAPNLQGAIESMQSDPAVKAAVQAAVITQPEVIGLLELGGGLQAARTSNLAIQNADKPFWYNPAFWVTIMLLPLVYWIVGSVLVGKDDAQGWWQVFGTAFNQETRSGTVNLVIGMVLGGIVGIWFGTSYGSIRKTELAAQQQTSERQATSGP